MNYAELNKLTNNIKSSYRICVKKLVDYISKYPSIGDFVDEDDAEELRREFVKKWIDICLSESIMLYNFVVFYVNHNYMACHDFDDAEAAADALKDSWNIDEISLPEEPSVQKAIDKLISKI